MTPNIVMQGEGFCISYNNYDCTIYGSVTTALVPNDMSMFYILNGNHRDEYRKLLPLGLDACYQYFLDNIHLKNKFSNFKPLE